MKQPSILRHWRPLFAAIFACVAAQSVSAADPDLPFNSGSTGADGPLTFREIATGRNSHAMAYDAVRQEVVMFGGYAGASLADTWVWRGTNWIQALPPVAPTDRWGHRMVWDAARGEVVMFGGTRNSGRLNDTWVWNGTTWTQKNPANMPSARDQFCMAYDAARQRVVIFGGNNGGDETWLWDGNNWTQATPAQRPPGSASSAMTYDAQRQQIVLFGNYGQTWIWDGSTWAQRAPLHTPQARNFPTLIQDGTSNTVLLFSGSNLADCWSWDGTDWRALSPSTVPTGRQYHSMVWDSFRKRGVLFGGDLPGVDNYSGDTWLWDGANWTFHSGKTQIFDARSKPSGIWNFTTINVPSGVTVRFGSETGLPLPPIRWLASGEVVINGSIDVSGQSAVNSQLGTGGRGGPGGYDGGRGGVKFNASASYFGSPGQGPGGGAAGTAQQTNPENLRDGQPGKYSEAYGNAFLQPLVGGSGGGGGASNNDWDGGNGGGGGGAIMIASSRDITLNGTIRANGGEYQWSNASYGGRGSGGAILLRADRVTGPGSLEAYGGTTSNPNGRIRVESYVRTLLGAQNPVAIVGLPSANGELNQAGSLRISSVAGVGVVQSPTGNTLTPDVVFSQAGPIAVTVTGTGIPDGTPVTLRINTGGSVISAGPVNIANGTATLSATVPKGVGTLQAIAQFTSN